MEMLDEVLEWGLRPNGVTGDSGYSSIANLKRVKNNLMGFMCAVESNRLVSLEKGTWIPVRKLEIPEEGMRVWLRRFGAVKLFRKRLKNQLRHYVVFLPNEESDHTFKRADFQKLHDQHWKIEQYHRMIKQVCSIEKFQVRLKVPILNHIFSSLCGYIHLQKMQWTKIIVNAYQWQRSLYQIEVKNFISGFIIDKDYLNPQFQTYVNA